MNHSHHPETRCKNCNTVETSVQSEASLEFVKEEKRNLQLRNTHLERANADLTRNFNEEVENADTLKEDLDDATEQLLNNS
jgi:hypothetical protein